MTPASAEERGATPSPVPGAPPSAAQLRRILGRALPAWDALLGGKGRRPEWRRYGSRTDWVLRLHEGTRTVLWARPVAGELRVTVVIGEKAVAAGLAGRLPQRLRARLRSAPVYPEGRAVRLRIRGAAGVGDVERLVALKLGRWR